MSRKSRQLRAGEVLIMCDGKPDCITLTDEEIAGLTPDDFLEAISNCCFDDLVVARMPNGQLRLVEFIISMASSLSARRRFAKPPTAALRCCRPANS